MKNRKKILVQIFKNSFQIEKKRKNTDREHLKRIDEIICDIPLKYKDISKDEFGDKNLP